MAMEAEPSGPSSLAYPPGSAESVPPATFLPLAHVEPTVTTFSIPTSSSPEFASPSSLLLPPNLPLVEGVNHAPTPCDPDMPAVLVTTFLANNTPRHFDNDSEEIAYRAEFHQRYGPSYQDEYAERYGPAEPHYLPVSDETPRNTTSITESAGLGVSFEQSADKMDNYDMDAYIDLSALVCV